MKTTIQTITREAALTRSTQNPATTLVIAVLAVTVLLAMVAAQAVPTDRDGSRRSAPAAAEFFLPAAGYHFTPGDIVMQDQRDSKYIIVPPMYVEGEQAEGTALFKVTATETTQIRLVSLTAPTSATVTPAAESFTAIQPVKAEKASTPAEVSLDRGNYRFVLGDVIYWNEPKNGFSAVPLGELLQEMKVQTALFLVTDVKADEYLLNPLNREAAGQADDINVTRVETAPGQTL